MKKIAITQRLMMEKHGEIREALDVNWAKFFKTLGFLPVVLPAQGDFKEYFRAMKIEGVLLTGGNDVSCVSNDKLSIMRDDFEKKLIKFAIHKQIPLLGVCRGMQVIADYFGAKIGPVSHHAGVRHPLTVQRGSGFEKSLKNLKSVNSFHDYGVFNLPDELIVCATSDDIIEAIEHKTHRVFGQMWHPEREEPFQKPQLDLMRKFFQ